MANLEQLGGPFESWRLADGRAVVEVSPGRGALVSRFEVDGVPVLFLDASTFHDAKKNVRGGIPVLFPFAGKPPAGSTLPQHGFARTSAWTVREAIADEATARVECALTDSQDTRAHWPHAFELRQAVSLSAGRLLLEWSLENRGPEPLPLHFGIHPYFAVGDKARVRVEGARGPCFDNVRGAMTEVERPAFETGEVDLHFFDFSLGGTTLTRGDGRTVRLSWTPQFDTLVVWTLPERPFVCVEPWTARGAQPATRHVAPGQLERFAVELWLE